MLYTIYVNVHYYVLLAEAVEGDGWQLQLEIVCNFLVKDLRSQILNQTHFCFLTQKLIHH